jgi:hypothetical protein
MFYSLEEDDGVRLTIYHVPVVGMSSARFLAVHNTTQEGETLQHSPNDVRLIFPTRRRLTSA